MNVGDGATANGTLNLQNGTVQTTTLWVGRNGTTTSGSTGIVNQSGGALTATNDFRIGENSNGTYYQTGGTVSAGYCRIGYGATGVGAYNITGGSATFTGTEADLGAMGTGTLNVGSTPTTSGSITLPVLYLGRSFWADGLGTDEGGTGNLVLSGTGSATVNGNIIGSSLASDTGKAHITLNGGTLTANGIGKAAGGAGGLMDIVFNGGVLKAGTAPPRS